MNNGRAEGIFSSEETWWMALMIYTNATQIENPSG